VADVEGDVIGFEVDSVAGVVRIPVSSVEPLPRLRVPDSLYVSAVSRIQTRLLLLVDVTRLVADTEVGLPPREHDRVSIEIEEGVLVS
jgi:chemotaxis signal transduction protein